MSARTGLSAEVPTLDLCREMAAIPALAEAFKKSSCVWWCNKALLDEWFWEVVPRATYRGLLDADCPAPTVREILEWLERLPIDHVHVRLHGGNEEEKHGAYVEITTGFEADPKFPDAPPDRNKLRRAFARITDPDALALACIEASKEQP